MKIIAAAVVAVLGLSGCAGMTPQAYVPASPDPARALTVTQARDGFIDAWKDYVAAGRGYVLGGFGSVFKPVFHPDGVTLTGFHAKKPFRVWIPADNARNFTVSNCEIAWDADRRVDIWTMNSCPGVAVQQEFADALAAWAAALQAAQSAHGFDSAVSDYRAAAVKPELPEAARAFKVQAEVAVQEKRFADATDLYYESLAIAPWWPEGRYNRALILAETGEYATAAQEMKRYLALVPDAANARAAQDKVYEWDGKARSAAHEESEVVVSLSDNQLRLKKEISRNPRSASEYLGK